VEKYSVEAAHPITLSFPPDFPTVPGDAAAWKAYSAT